MAEEAAGAFVAIYEDVKSLDDDILQPAFCIVVDRDAGQFDGCAVGCISF